MGRSTNRLDFENAALFGNCRETEELVSKLEQPEAGSSPLHFDNQFPQPLWRQTLIILVKNLVRRLPATQHSALPVR